MQDLLVPAQRREEYLRDRRSGLEILDLLLTVPAAWPRDLILEGCRKST